MPSVGVKGWKRADCRVETPSVDRVGVLAVAGVKVQPEELHRVNDRQSVASRDGIVVVGVVFIVYLWKKDHQKEKNGNVPIEDEGKVRVPEGERHVEDEAQDCCWSLSNEEHSVK